MAGQNLEIIEEVKKNISLTSEVGEEVELTIQA